MVAHPHNSSVPLRQSERTAGENRSPAMQTMLEQPPAALPTLLLLGGIVFSVTFGAWAWLGSIEEVGHASGSLVPKGDVYKVHPVEQGKVVRIAVKEGEEVKKGQVLMELDTQLASTEVEGMLQQKASYQVQLVQLQAQIEAKRQEVRTQEAIVAADISGQQVAIAQALEKAETTQALLTQLQADADTYQTQKERLEKQAATTETLLAQLQTDVEAYQAQQLRLKEQEETNATLLVQLQADADAYQARLEQLKPLVEEGAIARGQLFETEQALRDRQSAITKTQLNDVESLKQRKFELEQQARDRTNAIAKTQLGDVASIEQRLFEMERTQSDRVQTMTQRQGEVEQAKGEVERLRAQLNQKKAQGQQSKLEALQQIQQLEVQQTQLKAKLAETENRIASAQTKLQEKYLYAPVTGVVSSLNVNHNGEVVSVGQTVAELASKDAPLVLQASLPTHEAGFVKTGMSVQVKFDAYPYQDYGIVSGKVTAISPDTKPDQQRGEVYKVEVTLERNFVTAEKQSIQFKPGQTATADIILRRRRIAEVLLDPIRQMQTGGIQL